MPKQTEMHTKMHKPAQQNSLRIACTKNSMNAGKEKARVRKVRQGAGFRQVG